MRSRVVVRESRRGKKIGTLTLDRDAQLATWRPLHACEPFVLGLGVLVELLVMRCVRAKLAAQGTPVPTARPSMRVSREPGKWELADGRTVTNQWRQAGRDARGIR